MQRISITDKPNKLKPVIKNSSMLLAQRTEAIKTIEIGNSIAIMIFENAVI